MEWPRPNSTGFVVQASSDELVEAIVGFEGEHKVADTDGQVYLFSAILEDVRGKTVRFSVRSRVQTAWVVAKVTELLLALAEASGGSVTVERG